MILAAVLIVLSWFLVACGVIALLRVKNIYTRMLSATLIDTVAHLFLVLGLITLSIVCYGGDFPYFCFQHLSRYLLLLAFHLLSGPVSAHVNVRSAYLTGVPIARLEDKEGGNYE